MTSLPTVYKESSCRELSPPVWNALLCLNSDGLSQKGQRIHSPLSAGKETADSREDAAIVREEAIDLREKEAVLSIHGSPTADDLPENAASVRENLSG